MKERRKNIYKGIAKNVIIKTIRDTIIFNFIIVIILYFFESTGMLGTSREDMIWFWKMVFTMLLFFNLWIIFIIASMHKVNENMKINKKMAEDIFSKNICVKVFPKEGHLKYKYFFEKWLPQIADYFAILDKNEKIKIVARFNKEYDKEVFIEYVSKKEFIDSYELFETKEITETT